MLENRKTILHVDDDPSVTQVVGKLLRHAGFQVDALNSPLHAMGAITRQKYRVVLLDIDMPHKSGMDLLTEIKEHDAGIQVIMLTGLVSVPTVLETMQRGAQACLFKPVDDPALLYEAMQDAFRLTDRWWKSLRDLMQRRNQQDASRETLDGLESFGFSSVAQQSSNVQ